MALSVFLQKKKAELPTHADPKTEQKNTHYANRRRATTTRRRTTGTPRLTHERHTKIDDPDMALSVAEIPKCVPTKTEQKTHSTPTMRYSHTYNSLATAYDWRTTT